MRKSFISMPVAITSKVNAVTKIVTSVILNTSFLATEKSYNNYTTETFIYQCFMVNYSILLYSTKYNYTLITLQNIKNNV